MLCVLMLMAAVAFGQYRINNQMPNGKDSTGKVNGSKQNTWSYTQEQLENVFYFTWDGQLKADTLRVRPNQYWDIIIDERTFVAKLLDVTGVGNFRKSNWEWYYNGASLAQTRDTTVRVRLRPTFGTYPVVMTGTTLPENKVMTFSLDRSQVVKPDSVYLTVRAFDAEGAGEGILTVNGNPLSLWPANSTNDNIVADVRFVTPASWWLNGSNTLSFSHTSTAGYRIDTMFVDFHTPDSLWYQKPYVVKDTCQLSYANFGEVDNCGNVKIPSDSLRYGIGQKWIFSWNKYLNDNPNSTVLDSVHESIEFWPVQMYGAGSTLQVQVKIIHAELPVLPLVTVPPPVSGALAPTKTMLVNR